MGRRGGDAMRRPAVKSTLYDVGSIWMHVIGWFVKCDVGKIVAAKSLSLGPTCEQHLINICLLSLHALITSRNLQGDIYNTFDDITGTLLEVISFVPRSLLSSHTTLSRPPCQLGIPSLHPISPTSLALHPNITQQVSWPPHPRRFRFEHIHPFQSPPKLMKGMCLRFFDESVDHQ